MYDVAMNYLAKALNNSDMKTIKISYSIYFGKDGFGEERRHDLVVTAELDSLNLFNLLREIEFDNGVIYSIEFK